MQAAPRSDEQIMSELNTTPLIDVMLVLLIMFIITIPIQTHSVQVDLPVGRDIIVKTERNKLVIEQSGALLWNGRPISVEALGPTLHRLAGMDPQPELHFEPHAEARYARVDEVLAVIKRANVSTMGFVGNERYARF